MIIVMMIVVTIILLIIMTIIIQNIYRERERVMIIIKTIVMTNF